MVLPKSFEGVNTLSEPLFMIWLGFVGPGFTDPVMGIPFFRDLASSPRQVEPPSSRQLEFQTAWDKGGILRSVLS